jgi:hypothetical protein
MAGECMQGHYTSHSMSAYKEVLAAIAIALIFAAFLPHIISIRSGKTKPHVFSWVI